MQEKIFKIKKNPCYCPYNKPEKPPQPSPNKNGEAPNTDDANGDQAQKSPSTEIKKKLTPGQ